MFLIFFIWFLYKIIPSITNNDVLNTILLNFKFKLKFKNAIIVITPFFNYHNKNINNNFQLNLIYKDICFYKYNFIFNYKNKIIMFYNIFYFFYKYIIFNNNLLKLLKNFFFFNI